MALLLCCHPVCTCILPLHWIFHTCSLLYSTCLQLVSEYAFTPQPNHRKGALLCLAAAAVGLGTPSADQLRLIVPPVLASFKDTDARVRYYACEALYNVAKV